MKKLIILATTLLLVGCGGGEGESKLAKLEKLRSQYNNLATEIAQLEEELTAEGIIAKEKKSVEVTNFAPGEFKRVVTVQGIVDGDEIISVNPTASGKVVELNVQVGQHVKKGQVMARIDDEVLNKTMRELKTALDLATTIYNKQAALWADSIGSEVQYIQAKNTKESLEAKIASLREQIELYVLRAPIDATVDVVNLRKGQMASPQMVGIMIANFENPKVKAQVSESYSAVVSVGQTIDVEFPDLNKTIPLKITAVSNFIDPKNRSFSVEADLPNVGELKANMLAKMGLVTYSHPNVISIPINLLHRTNSGDYVWLVDENNKAVKRSVKAGIMSENLVEIVEGLSQSDNVITIGYQGLVEGQDLKIQ